VLGVNTVAGVGCDVLGGPGWDGGPWAGGCQGRSCAGCAGVDGGGCWLHALWAVCLRGWLECGPGDVFKDDLRKWQ